MDPRLLVREYADAGLRGLGPRRIDQGAGLRVDDRGGFLLETLDVRGADDRVGLKLRGVQRDWIARRPVVVELAVRVAVARRRIIPAELRVAAEIEHVLMIPVPPPAHPHHLDSRPPLAPP